MVRNCGQDIVNIQGQEVVGGPVPWTQGVARVRVDSHWHFVLPWTGRRLVAIGFTIRSHANLSSEDANTLTSLGFRPSSSGSSPQEEPPQKPRATKPKCDSNAPSTADRPCEPVPTNPAAQVKSALEAETPLIIELCAGSAMLSAVAREHGFAILPVDHAGNRHRPRAHVLQLDLRRPDSWAFVRKVVPRAVLHVHIALPCGTCSRAREIGGPADGPPPLRDGQHVWGYPWLTGEDLGKVQSANSLYQEAASFCEHLLLNHPRVGFSIENPLWSWLWQIPPIASLVSRLYMVSFDSCRHGSRPKKATAFLTNVEQLSVLSGPCPGCDFHERWGKTATGFATATEAAYPKLLCERLVQCLTQYAASQNRAPNRNQVTSLLAARVAAQKQPRGRKYPPLLSEFGHTVSIRSPNSPPLSDKATLSAAWHGVPKGSKLLRESVERGTGHSPNTFAGCPDGIDQRSKVFLFGVYGSPRVYVNEALSLEHPFDSARALPDPMLRSIFFSLTQGPLAVLRHRLSKLQEWRNMAKNLEGEDRRIKDSLHPDVGRILRNKCLALLFHIAKQLDWPDANLERDLCSGFKLTGFLDRTGVFAPGYRTASTNLYFAQKIFESSS